MLAYGGFLEESDEVFERTFKVNLYAPYKLVKAMLLFLLRGREPRIINTSSGAGIFDEIRKKYDIASYRLSKFALNGFTITLANELKGKIAVLILAGLRRILEDQMLQDLQRILQGELLQ